MKVMRKEKKIYQDSLKGMVSSGNSRRWAEALKALPDASDSSKEAGMIKRLEKSSPIIVSSSWVSYNNEMLRLYFSSHFQ